MANVPQLIKIDISLKMLPNNTAVHFKSDGARFGQTRTIKLLTGSKYKLGVVMKPGAAEATSMSIGGVTFPLEQQSKDPQSVIYSGLYDTEGVAHTKSGERQPVQISIQGLYSAQMCQPLRYGAPCSILHSSVLDCLFAQSKGVRSGVADQSLYCSDAAGCVPWFTEAGEFETVWQVKFYNYNKRDHCQWGNSFNSIEYECKPNDTRTLMWINKETFL